MSQALLRLKAAIASSDPNVRRMIKAANEEILRLKLVTPGAVGQSSILSNLAIQYGNEEYIGTKLMPVSPVDKMAGQFYKMGRRDRRALPPAQVGPRSSVNEVESTYGLAPYAVQPFALKGFVDNTTILNQDEPLDAQADNVEGVADAIELNTEVQIATVLTTAANFGSNTVTLSGSSQWNSSLGGSPIADIQAAVMKIEAGAGSSKLVGYCGPDVANALQRSPVLLDLWKYSSQGLVPLKQVASYFGLDDILVGKARIDTANIGQTEVSDRVWGKHFGIVRVAQSTNRRTLAFGWTLRFGGKYTTQWFDPAPGHSGGYWAKVAVADDYRVAANDAGFLIANAVA
jgi:hypothetical protein